MISISNPTPKPFSSSLFPSPHRTRPLSLNLRHAHFKSFLSNSQENPRRVPSNRDNLLRPFQKKPLPILLPPQKIRDGSTATRRSNTTSASDDDVGKQQMWVLCGLGYWVQGFRCFPWLAFNFHMAHGIGVGPSTLQLVQNTGNLPMVFKPLYGVLSDGLYIGGAHRLPYISFGVLLQVMSWGTLALIPLTGDTFPTQIVCILLGNIGASFTEVASDALVAEFSKTQKAGVLQSYAFMALAVGGILGNLSGGYFLLKSQQPKLMFLAFTLLLSMQLALSLTSREDTLHPSQDLSRHKFSLKSVSEILSKQSSDLISTVSDERIFQPLLWIVASIAVVPLLTGTMFCFQTQCLKLDPSIIGLSKVVGQVIFLSTTFVYNHYLKKLPLRRLIFGVQTLYALSLLSDLLLVKQINLRLGISNEAYVLCFSALAEAAAQFKILPFTVLLASLCPAGCEGSLFAFFASAICLSSILSGVFGVGLASMIGLSAGDYSALPLGIVLQAVAALLPLAWISHFPTVQSSGKDVMRRGKKLKLRS